MHTHTCTHITTAYTHQHTHSLKVVSSRCKVFNLASTCASVAKRQKLPQSTSLPPSLSFSLRPSRPFCFRLPSGTEYQANCKNKNNYTFLLLQLAWKPNWKWTSHKKFPFSFIFSNKAKSKRVIRTARQRAREREGSNYVERNVFIIVFQ